MDRKIKKVLSFAMACVLSLGMFAGCDQGNPGETELSTDPEESKISPEERGYYLAEDYVADPSLFVPSWADEWQPPAEMLDFEEKYNSFFTPNGRMMSIAHRGDRNVLYPENSIEGILSVIMAGADIVEIDVILTKDGIPVVFHGHSDCQRLQCGRLPHGTVRACPPRLHHHPQDSSVER